MQNIENLQEKLDLAQRLPNPNTKNIVALAVGLGEELFFIGKSKEAYKVSELVADNIDKITEERENHQLKGIAYSNLGFFASSAGNISKGIEYLTKAKDYLEPINSESLADVYVRLGSLNWNLGNYDEGLKYTREALMLAEKYKKLRTLGFSAYLLGGYFIDLKDYEQAERYYKRAYKSFEETKENNGIGRIINGLANVHYLKGEYDLALENAYKALEIHTAQDNQNSISRDYNDLGKFYTVKKQYQKAFEYYGKALKIRLENNFYAAAVTTLYEIGKLHLELGSGKEAIVFLKKALKEADKLDAKAKLFKIHLLMSEAYKEDKNYEKAFFHLEKYNQIKELALGDENSARIKNLETQFEAEKARQESEIYRLRNIELREAYAMIEEKNRDITASINYAQRIQNAFSSREEFKELFPKSFLIYVPRDIVSGDFMWTTKVANKKILVVADCTGHGVPGAIMTVLGRTLLKNIVEERNIIEPSQILYALDKSVRESLHQETSNTNDGMDAAILVIDEVTKKIEFSGAKLPLILAREGKVERIKGSSFAIGGKKHKSREKEFHTHTLDFQEKDRFFLFSDGYQDQFGGKENRKFMSKNLIKTIEKSVYLSCYEQYPILKDTFFDWKGERKQTDDVILVAIEL
ncbi:tetratricopeptide repeat protein [Bernardetia sp.]|uniref:tetratricopeptide repeat protein n=1 Tax=Bernardetia sp. TaxID=1937974 RepID=UPI0025BCEDAA|nr:tetratricopeptide repeat protein [Bernardetia sp.]